MAGSLFDRRRSCAPQRPSAEAADASHLRQRSQTGRYVDFVRVTQQENDVARLGEYEYPEIELNEAIDIGRRIARQFGGSISRSNLAASLGMSERGGRFAVVVGGLRLWGIAEGRSTLRVTRPGLRASSPVDVNESAELRTTLSRRIPLFNEIASRIRYEAIDPGNLTFVIEEITRATRAEVQQRQPALERTLRDVMPYLRQPGPIQATSSIEAAAVGAGSQSESPGDSPGNPAGNLARGLVGQGSGRIRLSYPGGELDLEESRASLDSAIALLQERQKSIGE